MRCCATPEMGGLDTCVPGIRDATAGRREHVIMAGDDGSL